MAENPSVAKSPLSAENQDALADLLVAIEANGRRLGIFIAVCDDPQLREEIISRYERELADEFRHYRLRLTPEEPSVKALLSEQVKADAALQSGELAVMTILGSEGLRTLSFDEEPSQQQKFFGYLQWTREGLQDFPFAIVLWVTYQLQEQLSRNAPDFWSWRRDVVRFVSLKRQAIPMEDLSVLRSHEQFSSWETVGNTMPIDDLEALIQETEKKSPNRSLLASLHLQTGQAYGQRLNVGASQDYTKEAGSAITHLKAAAQLFGSSDDSLKYVKSITWLGYLYTSQGRYTEAEPLYVQALEISKTELSNNYPIIVSSLNNLALLYKSQMRYEEAEPLFVEALDIRKKILGNNHPGTASSLNNLALIYEYQERYGEAEPLYLQALEIRRAVLGDNHLDTAFSLNNLALLYTSQGRYGEAEPLYLQALEIRKAVLGNNHPYTAGSLFNLSVLYRNAQQQQKALAYIQQALDIYTLELGSAHPTTQAAMRWLKLVRQMESMKKLPSRLANTITELMIFTKVANVRWMEDNLADIRVNKKDKKIPEMDFHREIYLKKEKIKQELKMLSMECQGWSIERTYMKLERDMRGYEDFLNELDKMRSQILLEFKDLTPVTALLIHRHLSELLDQMWNENDLHKREDLQCKLIDMLSSLAEDTVIASKSSETGGYPLPEKTLNLIRGT